MAQTPIGITFLPSADAAANGPRQAGIEGQGGSDLTQAFKILSLHLPRVLGAAAIAPKRLLTSPGAAGVALAGGGSGASMNPYSAVFESLLRQLTGGAMNPGGGDVASLSSLFGGSLDSSGGGGGGSTDTGASGLYGGVAPSVTPGDTGPKAGEIYNAPVDNPPVSAPTSTFPGGNGREQRDPATRYI